MSSHDPDIENWDDIEQNLHPDSSSDSDNDDETPHHYQNNTFSNEKNRAALSSGQELIKQAKQRKPREQQTSAADSLAKQRHLLSKREGEVATRPLSPVMPPRSKSPQVIKQELISPRSPRLDRAAPTLRRSGERPTPSLILPDECRPVSPGPVRVNTPLPNIRMSQSLTNLVPTPPMAPRSPKSPRRSPRIQRKRNSIEELCDQLDDQMTVSKSDQYDSSYLGTPRAPERSKSSDSLMPLDQTAPKQLSKLKPLTRPESPRGSFNQKPVLKPI